VFDKMPKSSFMVCLALFLVYFCSIASLCESLLIS